MSGTSNYLLTGAITVTLTQNTFINSLGVDGGLTLNLAGFTLQLASGAVLTETSSTDFITNSVAGTAAS